MNCELLGLSIDSIYSHLAWVQNIKEKFGTEITFPIIEDLSMRVATAYGMIHPGASDTSAVRATFIIDDKGILRAMIYYPMTNGRSVPEVLRLVKALQTSLTHGVATSENWQRATRFWSVRRKPWRKWKSASPRASRPPTGTSPSRTSPDPTCPGVQPAPGHRPLRVRRKGTRFP